MSELGRWLTVDPGEDTGFALWQATKLLGAHTEKMWPFADDVWDALDRNTGALSTDDVTFLRPGIEASSNTGPIELIVCEDFRVYPWKARDLAWDQVRTARLIGALYFMARTKRIPFVLQGAKIIKDRAVSGGAEELFYTPLHENRHQNDAIMHGWFYIQTELLHQGDFSRGPNN